MWISSIGRVDARGQPVRELHHVDHVGRLDHVPVAGVAVAEVEQQLDVGRHVIGKIDQNAAKVSCISALLLP